MFSCHQTGIVSNLTEAHLHELFVLNHLGGVRLPQLHPQELCTTELSDVPTGEPVPSLLE